MDKETKESHESYGMMSFSRVSGGDSTLFGSSIPHSETIQLVIGSAEVERGLHTDWYYRRNDHIVIEMSHSQFSEAITSMNMGSGIPVTIKRLNGKRMAEPPFTNKRIQFEEEFKAKMEDLEKSMRHLTENAEDILTNKKTVSKADRTEILNNITRLRRQIASDIPFMSSMYNEQMDKTTNEAKGEIEAFTLNKVNQLGLNSLQELQQIAGMSDNRIEQSKQTQPPKEQLTHDQPDD